MSHSEVNWVTHMYLNEWFTGNLVLTKFLINMKSVNEWLTPEWLNLLLSDSIHSWVTQFIPEWLMKVIIDTKWNYIFLKNLLKTNLILSNQAKFLINIYNMIAGHANHLEKVTIVVFIVPFNHFNHSTISTILTFNL